MQYQLLARRCINFLGSKLFFAITVLVFFIEAAWIALSARYPQAFDEQFHLGIIQLYAHQWSPFFSHQVANADQYGAVTRDPSYLYHYLMSFPWRLITHLTGSFTTQVIVMRFLNIGLLGSSLFIFRKVLALAPASKALINTSLFLFVLTPVVPLLGSQINYDNMIIPLTGLAVLWCVQLVQQIKHRKLALTSILRLLALCLFASLVKYAYLPIFAAVFLIVFVYAWRAARTKHLQIIRTSKAKLITLGTFVVIGIGLFTACYGVNMLRYHTPTPECDQVLSIQQCEAYAPWARNYDLVQHKVMPPLWQIALYPLDWLYHSMGELIFSIGSAFDASGGVEYYVGAQTIVIEVLAWTIFGIGLGLSLYYAKYLWRNEVLRIFIIISGLYALALWVQNVGDYLHTGQPLAIHGRYLLPILPLVYGMVALLFRKLLQVRQVLPRVGAPTRNVALTAVVFALLITQGGGVLTFIIRSDPRWFWPQSSQVQTVNANAKKLLDPMVFGD